jgi:hypothetical protein
MKDIYRKNKHSGQPMAIKNIDTLELNHLWLDRLITSLYIVLSVSLTVISLALTLGSVI